MNPQNVEDSTLVDQCNERGRHVFLSGINLIYEQARINNYLAQLFYLKPSPALLKQTSLLRYETWIGLVADRLMELGVPADEVNEHVIDFPWYRDRFDHDASAWVTADEYFHLFMHLGREDTQEDAVPRVCLSERIAYDPESLDYQPF